VFSIPALTRPATATPATFATPRGAVAAVAVKEDVWSSTATPATSATNHADVAGVADVAVADAGPHDPVFRRAVIAARDAAGLEYWRAPLLLGRLHLCGNCARYAFGPDPAGSGTCPVHGADVLAFAMPFDCADFLASPIPTAPEFLTESAQARAAEHPK
jgi:hypothetical protein